MRIGIVGPTLLLGGIAAELTTAVAAIRQISAAPFNPYLGAVCFGVGLGITIVGAMWTSRRDRIALEAREQLRLKEAKQERGERERQAKEWHEENKRAIHANGEIVKDLKKLVEGGVGYPGLLAASERSEWRRHNLMNVLTPVLNDLSEMAQAVCDLCEKEGIRFREEIADTFRRAAEKLSEQPPFPSRRLSDL